MEVECRGGGAWWRWKAGRCMVTEGVSCCSAFLIWPLTCRTLLTVEHRTRSSLAWLLPALARRWPSRVCHHRPRRAPPAATRQQHDHLRNTLSLRFGKEKNMLQRSCCFKVTRGKMVTIQRYCWWRNSIPGTTRGFSIQGTMG